MAVIPRPSQPSVHETVPQRSLAWETAVAAALFLGGLAFLLARIGQPSSIYDEGLILVGAERVFRGDVPFRDFWNTHPPGQIWLTAGLFRLFGETMLSLRIWDAVVKAGLALSLYRWAALGAPRWAALMVFAVVLLWLDLFGQYRVRLHRVPSAALRPRIHGLARSRPSSPW